MAGIKGRSGRRSHYDELTIAEVVNLSIRTCRQYLQDESIPLEKRAELARHFAIKAMPQKIEGIGSGQVVYIVHNGGSNTEGLKSNRVAVLSSPEPAENPE